MFAELGQAVEEAVGISSPTRRKKKNSRSRRTYGPVKSYSSRGRSPGRSATRSRSTKRRSW